MRALPRIRLPNARQGQTYRADVVPDGPDYRVANVDGLEDTGLAWVDGQIVGCPSVSGELCLTVTLQKTPEGQVCLPTVLIINPDPRTLWREREPDTELHKKPHVWSATLDLGGLRVLGASRRGRAHAHAGGFREDDFRLLEGPGGWLFVAVSDGAGSAELSRLGSARICEFAVGETSGAVEGRFERELASSMAAYERNPGPESLGKVRERLASTLGKALHRAFLRLNETAAAEGVCLDELAATLLFAMLKRTPRGWIVVGFGVGDGVLALSSADGTPTLLAEPDGGDYAGQTRFVTTPEVWADTDAVAARWSVHITPRLHALAVMTDGVSDPMFDSPRALREAESWRRFFSDFDEKVGFWGVRAEAEALEWLNFFRTGEHDDRTLVIVREEGGERHG